MAKLTGPLMSESAHGKLGKSLIYSKKQTGNIVRGFHMPGKEPSLKQWTQRHIIGLLTAQWQTMTAAQKLVYENLAITSKLNLSGFNYFIKVAQADLYTHHGLCGYWSMNESTGNQVLDYSGNKNHGTLLPADTSLQPQRVNAMTSSYGKAVSLTTGNNSIRCADSPTLKPTGSITIEAWVNLNNASSWGNIIAKNSNEAYRFRINQTSRTLWLLINDGTINTESGISQIPFGNWTYVSAVFNAPEGKVYFYINNKLDSSPNMGKFSIYPAGYYCILGAYNENGAEALLGKLDEVRLYNRALSADEIFKHYNLLRLDKKRQPLLIH